MSNDFGSLLCATASEAERPKIDKSSIVLFIRVPLMRMLPYASQHRRSSRGWSKIIHPSFEVNASTLDSFEPPRQKHRLLVHLGVIRYRPPGRNRLDR